MLSFAARRLALKPSLVTGAAGRATLQVEALEERAVPAVFAVATEAQLNAAIASSNANGEADTIALTADVSLTAGPTHFTADGTFGVTLDGQSHRLTQTAASQAVVYNQTANLTVQNVALAASSAAGGTADGIYNNSGGHLDVANVTIQGAGAASDAAPDGHGIYNYGRIGSIANTTITGFRAGSGAGIYNSYNAYVGTIAGSTIAGNAATNRGGGIANFGKIGVISDSTITGNTATTDGGGIANRSYIGESIQVATIGAIHNSTITGNAAGSGGGIANTSSGYRAANLGAIATISSTILSGNTATGQVRAAQLAGADFAGTAPGTADHSLLGTTSGFAATNGNILSDTPQLGALANNGGTTLTMLPAAGSAAIDHGANVQGLSKDQRGNVRTLGAGTDIGAVETGTPPVVPPTIVIVPGPTVIVTVTVPGPTVIVTVPGPTVIVPGPTVPGPTVFVFKPDGVIPALYRNILGREPDPAGMQGYAHDLEQGATVNDIARGLWNSPEHRMQQVQNAYRSLLGRAADPEGLAGYAAALLGGACEEDVFRSIMTSPEFLALHPDGGSQVAAAFQFLLGRLPNLPAEQFYVDQADAGAFNDVLGAILGSTERLDVVVKGLYADYLGRSPTDLELASFHPLAGTPNGKLGALSVEFLSSAEFLANAEGPKPA